MLKSLQEIIGYKMNSTDGLIGKCKDALFDDEKWTVRYLDVDTGDWLPGRRVLISPISLGEPDWQSQVIPTSLSNKQIEGSPDLESNKPVSKQWEDLFYTYHGWSHYASGTYRWGYSTYPRELAMNKAGKLQGPRTYDAHLRSMKEVKGYKIKSKNDEFGAVQDLIFDDETWSVKYVVIDTIKWVPSKSVLISPDWVSELDCSGGTIQVEMTKEQIENAPSYDASMPVNREYETRLYDFYGRPKYWENNDLTRVY